VLITAFVGWAVWITRKAFGAMSRKEHDAVCDKKTDAICAIIREQNTRVEKVLERIFEKMDEERSDASEKRHDLHEKVNQVGLQVASLKATIERRRP
jgi:uncharacterized protein (UPF0335 family)